MLLGARMFFGGASLPYDAEVEYLESTGTQWIDTGVKGAGSGYLETRFASLVQSPLSTYWRYFGASNGGTASVRTISYNDNGDTRFEAGYDSRILGSIGNVFEIPKTRYQVPSGSVIGDLNFNIFTYNGPTNVGKSRFYFFRMWDSNNTLVRDFIPVRFTNEQGVSEGAMYDRVSGELFRNAGTGAFTIGPDASAANGGGGGISANA